MSKIERAEAAAVALPWGSARARALALALALAVALALALVLVDPLEREPGRDPGLVGVDFGLLAFLRNLAAAWLILRPTAKLLPELLGL